MIGGIVETRCETDLPPFDRGKLSNENRLDIGSGCLDVLSLYVHTVESDLMSEFIRNYSTTQFACVDRWFSHVKCGNFSSRAGRVGSLAVSRPQGANHSGDKCR